MANQYVSEELGEPAVGVIATVTGSEARHAVTVSRLAAGETVRVGNGAGSVATGTVTAVAPGEFSFEVVAIEAIGRPSPAIWLAQALAKGDRDELAIQAATELGVDGIIPWSASRSISRWEGAKVAKGQQRWEAVVREATKQSARAWLPEVSPIVTTRQLAALAADALVIVLDPLAEGSLTEITLRQAQGPLGDQAQGSDVALRSRDTLRQAQGPLGDQAQGPEVAQGTSGDQAREPTRAAQDIVLVVGPEGGIAPAEFELLYAAGAIGARLGPGILRTSTAGPAAIAVLSAKLGRW